MPKDDHLSTSYNVIIDSSNKRFFQTKELKETRPKWILHIFATGREFPSSITMSLWTFLMRYLNSCCQIVQVLFGPVFHSESTLKLPFPSPSLCYEIFLMIYSWINNQMRRGGKKTTWFWVVKFILVYLNNLQSCVGWNNQWLPEWVERRV